MKKQTTKVVKKIVKNKIYVMCIKAQGDAPSLWIDAKDTQKFLESKIIEKIFKLKK